MKVGTGWTAVPAYFADAFTAGLLSLLPSPSVLNLSTLTIPMSLYFLLCIWTKDSVVRSWAHI